MAELFENKNKNVQLSEEYVYQFSDNVIEQMNIELWTSNLISRVVNITVGFC